MTDNLILSDLKPAVHQVGEYIISPASKEKF